MATLAIGWCPELGVFLAESVMCGLSSMGYPKDLAGRWWGIPRDRAVELCEALHAKGAELIWLGADLPAPPPEPIPP